MAGERQIQEAILQISGNKTQDTVTIVECTVDSVSESSRTCDCTTLDGIKISGVRLMSEVDDGVLTIPTIGSIVIVCHTKRLEPFICQFSSVDRVLIITGDTTIEAKDGSVKFNDGSFDGLVKIGDLITKLNNLENIVNQFIGLYNGHVHASSGVTTVSLVTQTLTPTQQSELENTLITHGK